MLSSVALLGLLLVLLAGAFRSDLNVGLLAVAMALVLGTGWAGMQVSDFGALLPGNLILTLIGVTLFFEFLRVNGTLNWLTQRMLRLAHGDSRKLPVVFFLLTLLISALGPGNIAATALVAPVAMQAGVAAGVSPLLMAVVVCTGANAGTFSPVAVTGNINTELLRTIGLEGGHITLQVFVLVGLIQTTSAVLAYLGLGGLKKNGHHLAEDTSTEPLSGQQKLSLLALLVFIVGVVGWKWPASMTAVLLVTVLALLKSASTEEALKTLPWSVMVLISGISVLIGLLEKTGSLDLLTAWLAHYTHPAYFHAALAFISGLASVGSSSSGVVMPLFIPLVPELVEQVGGGSLPDAVVAIDVGSHMVDVSPLSTLGALCLAALPEGVDRNRVFRQLLVWGLSMTVVGALLAFVVLDVLR